MIEQTEQVPPFPITEIDPDYLKSIPLPSGLSAFAGDKQDPTITEAMMFEAAIELLSQQTGLSTAELEADILSHINRSCPDYASQQKCMREVIELSGLPVLLQFSSIMPEA